MGDSAEIENVVLKESAIPFQPVGTERVRYLQRCSVRRGKFPMEWFVPFVILIAQTGTHVHRGNPTAVRHRCAQCCDSENEHSALASKTSTAL